jgi:hypothetical protein
MVNRRASQKRITDLARGQPCMIRLPGHHGNPETVCACHFRLPGLSGLGFIPDALFIAFGCDYCHHLVDTDKSDAVQLAFAHGVFRTQAWLLKEGKLSWRA